MTETKKADPVAEKILAKLQKTGRYSLVAPLDYLILGELPEEGELVLGVYPKGMTSEEVAAGPVKGALKAYSTSMRLRLMQIQGLVSSCMGVGNKGKRIYQRTPLGKQLYEEWKEKSGDISS